MPNFITGTVQIRRSTKDKQLYTVVFFELTNWNLTPVGNSDLCLQRVGVVTIDHEYSFKADLNLVSATGENLPVARLVAIHGNEPNTYLVTRFELKNGDVIDLSPISA